MPNKLLTITALGLALLLASCQRDPVVDPIEPVEPVEPPLTAEYLSRPALTVEDADTISDSIVVDAAGFVGGLKVVLDLEHTYVGDLIVTLEHEETGTVVTLVDAPSSNLDNIRTFLTDAAALDIQDDVGAPSQEGEGEAYQEARYRPTEPLEFFYGEAVEGTWTLSVTDTFEDDGGTLNAWGFTFDARATKPAPTLFLGPARGNLGIMAPGTVETFDLTFRRLSGLSDGPITVTAMGAGVSAEPLTIPVGETEGLLTLNAAPTAAQGARPVTLTAATEGVTRTSELALTVSEFASQRVARAAYLPLAKMGAPGGAGNDIWGWSDPETGAEIAMMGTTAGVSFVDVSDPTAPVYLGVLPSHNPESFGNIWRDIKVYQNHAFVVSEASDHGLQVFDLTRLRGVGEPETFGEDGGFRGFGNAHNLAIDEETGFAYIVGATDDPDDPSYRRTCFGGLLMLDIGTPKNPKFAGCFAGGVPEGQAPGDAYPTDVYIHDAQCVVYRGPDTVHVGQEICFTSDGQVNEGDMDYVGIADVSSKKNPVQLSRLTYEGSSYAHQGWLTEDHAYFLFNDEGDELEAGIPTRTYIFDVRDLDNPVLLSTFDNPRDAIGHNLYVRDNHAYQANYTSGLRILDLTDVAAGTLTEVAYFDTYPEDDADNPAESAPGNALKVLSSCAPETPSLTVQRHPENPVRDGGCAQAAQFSGTWSVYPYFESGTVVMSDIDRGLFVLQPEVLQP